MEGVFIALAEIIPKHEKDAEIFWSTWFLSKLFQVKVNSSTNYGDGHVHMITVGTWEDFSAMMAKDGCSVGAGVSLKLTEFGDTFFLLERFRATLHVRTCSAFDVGTEALVYGANQSLEFDGGLALEVANRAGAEFVAASKKDGALEIGASRITASGNLRTLGIFRVIHCVLPAYQPDLSTTPMRDAVLKALQLANTAQVKSVALPLMGCGSMGWPPEVAAKEQLSALMHWLSAEPEARRVVLFDAYANKTAAIRHELTSTYSSVARQAVLVSPPPPPPPPRPAAISTLPPYAANMCKHPPNPHPGAPHHHVTPGGGPAAGAGAGGGVGGVDPGGERMLAGGGEKALHPPLGLPAAPAAGSAGGLAHGEETAGGKPNPPLGPLPGPPSPLPAAVGGYKEPADQLAGGVGAAVASRGEVVVGTW